MELALGTEPSGVDSDGDGVGDYSRKDYAQQMIDDYKAAGVQPGQVWPQSFDLAAVGYWIDEKHAGRGYVPEALVALCRFAFEEVRLHRIQVAIIPRNVASRRVVEKLALREEGLAQRYLEINGVWEDHIRYAITSEEWEERGGDLSRAWLD